MIVDKEVGRFARDRYSYPECGYCGLVTGGVSQRAGLEGSLTSRVFTSNSNRLTFAKASTRSSELLQTLAAKCPWVGISGLNTGTSVVAGKLATVIIELTY
jgi:hypothetical protein